MTTISPTWLRAQSQLASIFTTVALAHPESNAGPGVVFQDGIFVTATRPNNYLQIVGLENYRSDWTYVGNLAREEHYDLSCALRAWDGDTNPTAARALADTLLDEIWEQMLLYMDGGSLQTATGVSNWEIAEFTKVEMGTITTNGWAIDIEFPVHCTVFKLERE